MLAAFLFAVLVSATAIMLAFPETPAAKAIHRTLVEAPARALLDLTWKKAALNTMLVLAFVMLAVAGPEMLMMFAAMGADAAAMEVMLVVFAASTLGGLGPAWRVAKRAGAGLSRIAQRMLPRSNRPRTSRRPKTRPQGRKDDADGPEWAFA